MPILIIMTSIFKLDLDPYPTDGLTTETSITQSETEQTILHTLRTSPPSPPTVLNRNVHASYIGKSLMSLPAPYVSLDASRPWLMYWSLHSFDILGIGLDQVMKDRAVDTILSFQHPDGGFGGGPGQSPHLLPTYASICTLAIVGSPEDWNKINRKGLYDFFLRCKRSDGSFVVCQGGEVDVRGIYCLLVCATLLGLLTPELIEGTDKFIASCQTYEGGFASSCSPDGAPMAEAHGGYASCAFFSWFLLRPLQPKHDINQSTLLRWAVNQQAYAIEGGGFRGRTNKLVDGCYGWWVGGLFAVLDSVFSRDTDGSNEESRSRSRGEDEWEDVEEGQDMLYNRIALQEYILICAQSEKGGLRDKPGKSSDLYHTTNNLSGLSLAQHRVVHNTNKIEENRQNWKPSQQPEFLSEREALKGETAEDREMRRKEVYSTALGWKEDDKAFFAVGGNVNKVVSFVFCPPQYLRPFIQI